MLRFTLPIVPSVNNCYRNVSVNKRILSAEGAAWKQEAQLKAKLAAKRQDWKFSEREKLVIEITTYWPDRRRRDTHNSHKLLCDTLEGVLYKDDRWVLVRDVDFYIDRAHPRVEVLIKRLGEDETA